MRHDAQSGSARTSIAIVDFFPVHGHVARYMDAQADDSTPDAKNGYRGRIADL
jgi:hypothetical protein